MKNFNKMEKIIRKTLEFLLPAVFTLSSFSCSNLQEKNLSQALEEYQQRYKTQKDINQAEQSQCQTPLNIPESFENPQDYGLNLDYEKHQYYNVLEDKKKKPETIEEALIPDVFTMQLNAPNYRSSPEKRELKFWNNIAKLAGYHGKIKGFSNRSCIDNAFLELEGEYFFSRIFNSELAKRTSLVLRTSYAKDEIRSQLKHIILPPIDINIKDEFYGFGLSINHYSSLSEALLFKASTGIDYSSLDVDVDASIGPIPIPGFDSNGEGFGAYIKSAILTKPNQFKILPENSSLYIDIGYRWEKLSTSPVTDNTGVEFGVGICIWRK